MWFFIYLNAEPSQIKVFADQNKVLKKDHMTLYWNVCACLTLKQYYVISTKMFEIITSQADSFHDLLGFPSLFSKIPSEYKKFPHFQ